VSYLQLIFYQILLYVEYSEALAENALVLASSHRDALDNHQSIRCYVSSQQLAKALVSSPPLSSYE